MKTNKLPRQQSQEKGLKISASMSNEVNKIDYIKQDKQQDLENLQEKGQKSWRKQL